MLSPELFDADIRVKVIPYEIKNEDIRTRNPTERCSARARRLLRALSRCDYHKLEGISTSVRGKGDQQTYEDA